MLQVKKGKLVKYKYCCFQGSRTHALTGLEVQAATPRPFPDHPQGPELTLTAVGQSPPFLEQKTPGTLQTWRSFCLGQEWMLQPLDQVSFRYKAKEAEVQQACTLERGF